MTPDQLHEAVANFVLVMTGALFMYRIVMGGDDDLQPPSRGRQA